MDIPKLRRTDFYPDDWLAGTVELTLEEEGSYIRICALIYSKGRPIPDNNRWLAGMCRISTRKWRTLRQALIDKEKITISDGLIHQQRCRKELERAAKTARNRAESGSSGGRKTAERRANLLQSQKTAPANAPATLKLARATPSPSPSTFPKGKDGQPPSPGAHTIKPTAVIFNQCLTYLTQNGVRDKNARALLGKWRKEYGEGNVIEIASEASKQGISEPVAWIEKALRVRYGSQEVAPL